MPENRVQFNNIVQNQLPQYVREEYPLIEDFLKQYYIAQEFDGAPVDLIQNIDQYIKLDNTTNLVESTELRIDLQAYDRTIEVEPETGTVGFPDSYGLLKIDDEIITYTGKTDTSFTGCVRGFSGISSYISEDNPEQLVFESTSAEQHLASTEVQNLSNLFLKEFLKKTKRQFLPLLDERKFDDALNQDTFIKQSKDFYSSRGTDRSFEILFKSLYNKEVEVVKPREYLFTPSNSDYRVTNDLIVEAIEGDPTELELATLIQQPYAFGSGIEKAYAPITAVETIVANDGETFYQLSIDAGYSRDISVDGATYGKFQPIPRTKNIGQISAGSTFFDVDSTVGFGTTGELSVTYNDESIGIVSYTSKSLTQFYGVSNVTKTILDCTSIGIDTCTYGQSTLDPSKRIKVRINQVINKLEHPVDANLYNAGDTGKISALGRKSRNFKTNSWFYNNYAKYNVKSVSLVDASDQTWDIALNVDHSFKLGDSVTITGQDGADKVGQVVEVSSAKSLTIKGQGGLNAAERYTIYRNILKASTINFVQARQYTSNVQNVYETNEDILVASSSLPSYTINTNDRTVKFSGTFVGKEFIVTSGLDHGLYTGDAVLYDTNRIVSTVYDAFGNSVNSLVPGDKLFDSGLYFVFRVNSSTIKLAKSRTDIFNEKFIEVESSTTVTDNTLQPYEFRNQTLESQKILRKVSEPIHDRSVKPETKPGYNGILGNGVEILNYKSADRVHFGEIKKIDVLDPGLEYDVVNPPALLIEDTLGTGATGNVSVRGVLSQLRILDSGFDYLDVPTVTISGGNGTPSSVSVNMKNIDHSVDFFADGPSAQVGLGTTGTIGQTIGFSTFHKFRNGERVIYDSVNQQGVGGMTTNSEYYVSTFVEEGNAKESFTKIKLYPTERDALAGINTVELTSFGVGKQSLRSFNKKSVVAGVNVISGGTYENKLRKVAAATGVSTSHCDITIEDHDYKDGEIIKYTSGDTGIGNLTDGSKYYVLKVSDDKFRLANVGVGTTNGIDYFYQSRQYIKFSSTGIGTHSFNYPDITVTVDGNVGIASTGLETFQADVQPIIRGQITSVNLENKGSGYGSGEIINHNRKPDVSLISGSQAEILPIVVDGKITEVVVLNKGKKYTSPPDIRITGDGIGASVTPILSSDGLLSSVKVVEPGSGYTQQNTSGIVVFTGRGVDFDPQLQSWTVNLVKKLESFVEDDDGFIERGTNRGFGLQYAHLYAPRKFRESVYSVNSEGDIIYGQKDLTRQEGQEQASENHSPIIGWAYDGHPIYGPYGYITKEGGLVSKLRSGYVEEAVKKENRPSVAIFPPEFFVEDFTFKPKNEDTVLDQNNGRFCVTPEYPNGTYAYFATIDSIVSQTAPFNGFFKPTFPYFIGNTFYGRVDEFNFSKQSNQDEFDLNNTDYFRNTKPYNLIEGKIKYKYLTIPNNLEQTVDIQGVTPGKIEEVGIITSGSGYKVNDELVFDNSGTSGSGVAARVSKVKGVSVESISVATSSITNVEIYPTGKNQYTLYTTNPHNFNNLDVISISGLSTSTTGLERSYVAGVTTTTYVFAGIGTTGGGGIGTAGASGIVTHFNVVGRDLGFDQIRENDIVGIGTEEVRVIEVLKNASALRVERASNGVSAAHTAGAVMTVNQRQIKINAGFKTDHNYKINRQYYFNPTEAVGLGSTAGVGIGTTIFFTGITSTNLGISSIFIPTQALYMPDHALATGDKVTYSPGTGGDGFLYSESGHTTIGSTSGVKKATDGQEFFVARFSDTLVGLATVRVGLGTTGIYIGLETGSVGGRNQTPVYFRSVGVGNTHSIKTTYVPITGEVSRNLVTVDTGVTKHGLHVGHHAEIDVNAGASTSFVFKYDDYHRKLIVDPREFTGGDITTTTDSITVKDHNLETGQKIIHTSSGPAEGLIDNKIYYAVKVDKDTIKLSETYYNSIQGIPEIVGIGTTGTGGTIKPINPPLHVFRDATVTFTLADGSLGYKVQGTSYPAFQLNFYKDSGFCYQYDKNALEDNFNVQRNGTIGVDGTATVTLTVNKDTPKLLYYKLDPVEISNLPTIKSEINIDDEVPNNNQFATKTSLYNGHFRVSSGMGNTQFSYSVTKLPEKSSYLSTDNAFITYVTDCTHTLGPIANIEIKDGGKNYLKLPGITTVTTTAGKNAILEPSSKSIGIIKTNKINKIGFDLSVDRTVRPSVVLPNIIDIQSFASFDSIGISSQGRGYSAAPHIVVLDGKDNTLVKDVDLKYDLGDTSVKILKNTFGMNNIIPKLIPTANTNGVGISTVGFNTVTKFATVELDVGFSTANTFPFVVGDKVLIEGVSVGVGSTGKGFNSSAYNYKLFTITSTDPNIGGVGATVSYSLDGDFDAGEVIGQYDDQNSAGRIIAEKAFPIYTPKLKFNDYAIGETVDSDTSSGIVEDWDRQNGVLKVSTTDNFVVNERIKGLSSNTEGIASSITTYDASFELSPTTRVVKGSTTVSGFLNESIQRVQDSLYYQNFSYALRSEIDFDVWDDAVGSTNHTAGFKKFGDYQMVTPVSGTSAENSMQVGVSSNFIEITNELVGFGDLNCVHDFDNVKENVLRIGNGISSNEIIFSSRILTDFFESSGNRVLLIDDMSGLFNSNPRPTAFANIDTFTFNEHRALKYFVFYRDRRFVAERELMVVTLTHDGQFAYMNQYGGVDTKKPLGRFDFSIAGLDGQLQFFPFNFTVNDYDIGFIAYTLDDNILGIGTTNLGGIVDIDTSSVSTYDSSGGTGITTTLVSVAHTYRSMKLLVSLSDANNEHQFNELNLVHDNNDVYGIDYGELETTIPQAGVTGFGTYYARLDGTNMVVDFIPRNSGIGVTINTIQVGIHSNHAQGIGTATLKHALIEARTTNIASSGSPGITTVGQYSSSFDAAYFILQVTDSTNKRFVMSELLMCDDDADKDGSGQTYMVEYGNVESHTGLGTFGTIMNGTDKTLYFKPRAGIAVSITAYMNAMAFVDDTNDNIDFTNGMIRTGFAQYEGTENAIKREFGLTHELNPIFEKYFTGNDSNVVSISADTINIPNHFFVTGETIKYKHVGNIGSAIGIAQSTFAGIGNTTLLPEDLFVIKINEDKIKLASSAENALKRVPIPLDITSVGIGTSHRFVATNQNAKVVLTLDNVIQSPVVATSVTTVLSDQVTSIDDHIRVSGITSYFGSDLIKINNEIMKIEGIGIGLTNQFRVRRGWLGTKIGAAATGDLVTKVVGNYNIIDNSLTFAEAPFGNVPIGSTTNPPDERDWSGISTSSSFHGRSFMRSGVEDESNETYHRNYVFDTISNKFNGIEKSFRLFASGGDVTGISTENAILLVNDVFQGPGASNDYVLEESGGISSVRFTGVAASIGNDVNTAGIPLGGVILSVGSTEGSGYQPLVSAGGSVLTIPASVVVGSAGSQGSISTIGVANSGSGYRVATESEILTEIASPVGVGSTVIYLKNQNSVFGLLDVLNNGDNCRIGLGSFQIPVDIVSVGGTFVRIGTGNTVSHIIPVDTSVKVAITTATVGFVNVKAEINELQDGEYIGVSTAAYNPVTGIVTVTTVAEHGLSELDFIKIRDKTLAFSCDYLSGGTKLYPRPSDPISGRFIQVTNVDAKSFEVQILDQVPSTNTGIHTFQYAHPNSIIIGKNIPEYHVGFATIMTGTGNISTNVSITNTEARFYSRRNISDVKYQAASGLTTVTTSTPHGLLNGDEVFVSGIAFTCDYAPGVNVTGAAYSAASGIMTVTTAVGHGLTTIGTKSSTVLLTGIAFTCQLDNGASEHIYPRATDPTFNGNEVLEVLSSTQFVVNVGISTVPTFYKSGGIAQPSIIAPRKTDRAFTGEPILRIVSPTSFEIKSGISTREHNYARGGTVDKVTNLIFDAPRSYQDIPLFYSSDSVSGVGSNAFVDISVGQGSSIIDFSIESKGYGYGVNEILTVPTGGLTGIPTTSAFTGNEFQLTVQKTFSDEFTGWTVGELQLLDSPAKNFDGSKQAFNLTLAGSLISILAKRGSRINVQDVILVFVNDVLQVPGEGYTFPGGSIITFTEPPKPGDSCKIIFYKGTGDTDVIFKEIIETVKKGDKLTISPNPDKGHPSYFAENDRAVLRVDSTDKVTTPIYGGPGNTSDENLERPVKWCRQTEDKIINEIEIGKDRELYEPVINPVAHITKSVGIGSSSVYVTNVQPFFNPANENDQTVAFQNKINFINQDARLPAFATANVSGLGTISSITISDGGAGYSTATVSVASTVGIGTTTQAFGNVVISGGSVTGVGLTNPGYGYTSANPPIVLISPPTLDDFEENSVNKYHGDHGVIVGFGTTAITGVTTQFVFDLHIPLNSFLRDGTHADSAITKSGIKANDYFMVFDSNIGSAATTIRAMDNQSGDVVAIGNSHIDNVYVVRSATDIVGPAGYDGLGSTTLRRVICDVQDPFTFTNNAGVNTTGIITTNGGNPYLGAFSWGRIDVKSRAGLNSYTAYTLGGIGTNDVTGIQTSMKVQRTASLKFKNYDT